MAATLLPPGIANTTCFCCCSNLLTTSTKILTAALLNSSLLFLKMVVTVIIWLHYGRRIQPLRQTQALWQMFVFSATAFLPLVRGQGFPSQPFPFLQPLTPRLPSRHRLSQ